MKKQPLQLILLMAALLCGLLPGPTPCLAAPISEYQLKAAFMYNFLQFVEWPKAVFSDDQAPYRIGILGDDPFGNTFDALKDKKVNDRSIEIVRLGRFQDVDPAQIKRCQMLFISTSESGALSHILAVVDTSPILTVSEMPNFVESGGVIGFVMEERKVRFIINLTAAEKVGLKIRSKLLKLAKNVMGLKAPLPEKD